MDQGVAFLREFYRKLAGSKEIETIRPAEHLEAEPPRATLGSLFAGSWIHHNFHIWVGDAEDVRAWEAVFRAREDLVRRGEDLVRRGEEKNGGEKPEGLAAAWRSLYAAEGSDWFWWYGTDRSSGRDEVFDALFRKHLANVYAFAGAASPDFLRAPISRQGQVRLRAAPSRYLRVKLDGRATDYFEWMGAGRVGGLGAAVDGGGAMAAAAEVETRPVLEDLHFGFDQTRLYLRLDLADDWRESVGAGAALRFIFLDPCERAWTVSLGGGGETSAAGLPPGAEMAVDELVEAAFPLAALGLGYGEEFRFVVEMVGVDRPERLPVSGWVFTAVPPEDFEQTLWDAY